MKIAHHTILGLFILLLIFSSCGNLKLQTWQPTTESIVNLPDNFWFSNYQPKALYKINIEAFHQKQSGMLIIKQDIPSSIRMLMITEFGLKVFDVEYFKGDSLQIHYIMKHLDSPYISNALFDNLKVLWPKIRLNCTASYFDNEKKKEFSIRLEKDKEEWIYQFDQDQKIAEILRLEKGRKKSITHFDSQTENIFLKTKHPSISIRLKKIAHAAE